MSQVPLSNSERILALQRFGYTECEAAFLCLAALHSGYFLRRQFRQFTGTKNGGTISQVIDKVLANSHAKASTWKQNTQLYHLCTRPFYEALGQGENRHRRIRALLAIKNKIMCLDFVLGHRGYPDLATEQEKLDYFTGTLKIDASCLPAKLYRSTSGAVTTTRYFVEKYPIFLDLSAPQRAQPVVSFSFIDEGAASISGFETFLDHYARLFAALPEFRVIYVADREKHSKSAEELFTRMLAHSQGSAPDPLISRKLEFFDMRKLYEAKDLASFDRAKLIRFREDSREFSGAENDALYRLWKARGEAAVLVKFGPAASPRAAMRGRFSTCVLDHDYGFFGRFPG
jgi:hypothetical protein